jgi:hypothetical protein
MLNLLPQEGKKRLTRLYRMRLLATGLFFGSLVFGISSASLLPTLFLSKVRETAMQQNIERLSASIERQRQEDAGAALSDANRKLSILAGAPTVRQYELVFDRVTKLRTAGMELTEFSIDLRGKKEQKVVIKGIAPRRSSLADFAGALGADAEFSQVSFPVADLAQNADIEFSLSATLAE